MRALGNYRGEPVTFRREGGRAFVSIGDIADLEYPIDLNGSFQNWVERRLAEPVERLACPLCQGTEPGVEMLKAHLLNAHLGEMEAAAKALGGSGSEPNGSMEYSVDEGRWVPAR